MMLQQARSEDTAAPTATDHPVYPAAAPGAGQQAPSLPGLPGVPISSEGASQVSGTAGAVPQQPPAQVPSHHPGAVPSAQVSGPWAQPSGPWTQPDVEPEVVSSAPSPTSPPVSRTDPNALISDMVNDIVGDSGGVRSGPAAASGVANAAAPGAPGATDGLDPSPEYIAAREAALQAVRAQKEHQQKSGPHAVASYPKASDSVQDMVAAQQRPQQPEDLNRSYTDALAALDVPEGRGGPSARPGAVPDKGSLIAIYDDDGVPSNPMADEASILTTPVTSWAPLPESQPTQPRMAERTATGARPLTARQAARRATGPAPGRTYAKLPIERNTVRMGIGLFSIAAGLVLLLWFLPTRAPVTPEERAAGKPLIERTGRPMRPDIYLGGQAAAGGFILVGLLFIMNGYFFKPKDEVVCKRCKRYVIAQRDFTVLKCPRSSHTARMCSKTVLLTLLLVACVGGTFFAIALGSIVRAT